MEKKFRDTHPKVRIAADVVLFGYQAEGLSVALIKGTTFGRDQARWALPGSFVRDQERLIETAKRSVRDKLGMHPPLLRQFGVFDAPERDDRQRVISIGFFGLVCPAPLRSSAQNITPRWWPMGRRPRKLDFDHEEIVDLALAALRDESRTNPTSAIVLGVLSKEFTLGELQAAHEVVQDENIDKRNFRRELGATDELVATGNQTSGLGRPAKLYKAQTRARLTSTAHN